MSNKVTVQITFTERVRYSAVVEMDVEKFDELDHALDNTRGADLRRVEESIVELCDRRNDWQDSDEIEIEDFIVIDNEELK